MKSDLRVVRTKQNIKKAFIDLLEEKGFDAISIKDITERGMMNRGTFYAHYLDKYDLLDQLKQSLIDKMTEIIDQHIDTVIEALDINTIQQSPQNVSVKMIEFINQEHRLFHILLVKQGDYAFQMDMKQIIQRVIESNFEVGKRNTNFDYISAYITSANIGILQQWLHKGRQESPEIIAQMIATITLNGPMKAMQIMKGSASDNDV
ncbi:TPA: TetR/AcrR family transcriptional regulator [Staphylococcus aureus]|nr:TetR/AcrR family transcriptional regulator [Staphylococcus aureus]HDG8586580.1 TetR/AcrR family transcriptional regulator [Staphylococcus aureus]HDZ3299433.1 TetR/AcrR family transcriptional regulator [Staphylococcus aureus]HDZ3315754.1 TetR/AcrR family transcriptional regulator [Staphylococcus aureus]HDZ3340413.1 TetR/AcrR family transcriptional regulator [Staphylococcus aureus]